MRSSSSCSATGSGVGNLGVGQNFVCKSGVFSLRGVGDIGGGGVGSLGGVGILEMKTKFVLNLHQDQKDEFFKRPYLNTNEEN